MVELVELLRKEFAGREQSEGVTKAASDNKRDCLFWIDVSRQTQACFRNRVKPREGRRYCFRCERFDGKRAYFVLEPL